jgi:hypothetical protein
MYEKQGFYSGQKLQASQLDAMEDGIINAEKLATEAIASAANMEKGTGVSATQQLQNQESGVTEGYFNFVGKNPAAIDADPSLNAELKYGAVGDYSASFGGKSTAIGKRALSEGTTTVAKGAYSHAEGNNSVTLGANSHAEGKCTVTIGENSHSEGFETIAGEFNSHAEGYKTIAKGSAAHAEGQETKAYSHQSHTEGLRTVAGDETNPEIGPYAHAEGQDTVAKGEASHAAGIGTIAAGRAQTVVGRYNTETPDNEDGSGVLFIVGNGNGNPESENERNIAFAVSSTGEAFMHYTGDATNEFSLVNAGQVAIVLDYVNEHINTIPTNIKNGGGENSIVGGINSIADYKCDFTFGEGLSNTFEHQTVFGKYNDVSDWGGNRPLFMIGNGTDADHRSNAFEVRNNGLVVVGNKVQQLPRADRVTKAEGEEFPHFDFTGHSDAGMAGRIQYGAVGNYSASMNGRSAALNKHAFAINNSTVAKGEESFAQGYETIAEGNSSFAGGTRTWAKGAATITFGDRTVAKGDYSSAFGIHTVAENNYQTVVGVANEIGDKAESLFEVGNGELDEEGNVVSRSTAFRVMKEGKVKIKDIWAKEDDDVIALGFLNHRLNEELLPHLGEAITAEFDAIRPYLVLTSGREDKTSIQAPTCSAAGLYSIALGNKASALSDYSVAIGKDISARPPYSIAMGVNSGTSGEAAFAAGVNAHASGAHSRAFGTNVTAGYVYQTVIGKDNLNKEGTLFEIGGGNGVEGDEREKWNVFEVYNDGLVVVGNKVQQMPDGVADGFDFTGKNANATTYDSTLTGIIPYGATGNFASAFGGKCAAIGKRSHAEGSTTIAKGQNSHAEGSNSVALGTSSHAEGSGTTAKGEFAHSEGTGTVAQGNFTHAEGQDTKAIGDWSHAGGWMSTANHDYSFVHGAGLVTGAAEQIVFGQYNKATDSLLVIGNGTSTEESQRKNVFEVSPDGDVLFHWDGEMYSLHKVLEALFKLGLSRDELKATNQ